MAAVPFLIIIAGMEGQMREIERKFLVKGDYRGEVYHSTRIVQGYLNSDPDRAVRVRIRGDHGYITVKGRGSANGMSRFEWEKEIAVDEAESLMALCESGVIDKIRHLVRVENHIFEVDEFFGDNAGLTVAEVELRSEDEPFDKPLWLGAEVTGESKYYNASLSRCPYKNWQKTEEEVGRSGSELGAGCDEISAKAK